MKMKCMIIEDEPLASEKLAGFIEEVPYLQLIGSFNNGLDGLGFLKENHVDLLFLDIQMDRLTGIELLEGLSTQPAVILTTAYQEYALKGYELNVSDYLLKPFAFSRFLQAVEKVYYNFKGQSSATDQLDCIFVKTEYRIEKILLSEIAYIEGMSDYLQIHLTSGKKIMCLQTFKSFEDKLPEHQFARVHKSFVVAMDKIEHIERLRITIKERLIPISKTYKEGFFELLEKQGLL